MSLVVNKKARFEYEILETFQAGIKLSGPEVKSVRAGQANLTGAYVIIRGNKATLLNAHISAYKPAFTYNPEPTRTRELLLKKSELKKLEDKMQDGLTCVPLSMYLKNNLIKVEIGLARGKKLHDKRRSIKDRETKRTISRTLRSK